MCVTAAFYAFYAFSAIVGSVSYGIMEGLKVQVPPPAIPLSITWSRAVTEL